MGRTSIKILAMLAIFGATLGGPAKAAEGPFEGGLLRLSEVLGSLHFLRNLCGDKGNQWRSAMERLLTAEKPEPERRARFIASFNRGYRSFEGTYSTCTDSATEAISRYMKEGEALTREIATKYGN